MRKYFLGTLLLFMSVQMLYGAEVSDDVFIDEDNEIYEDNDIFSEYLDDMFGEDEFIPETIINTSQSISGNGSSSGGSGFDNTSVNKSSYKTLSLSGRKAIHKKIQALYYGKSISEKIKLKLKLSFRIKSLEKKYADNEYAAKVLRYLEFRVSNY